MTTLTLNVLLGASLAGLGMETATLVTQNQHYSSLCATTDIDIEQLENSASHLQQSLASLAEIILQNRRGSDLIFLQQGELCTNSGEECCFYIDHSGMVKELTFRVKGVASKA